MHALTSPPLETEDALFLKSSVESKAKEVLIEVMARQKKKGKGKYKFIHRYRAITRLQSIDSIIPECPAAKKAAPVSTQ